MNYEYIKTTLPYGVRPDMVETYSCNNGVCLKVICKLPITILDEITKPLFFYINDKKAYLGDCLIKNNKVTTVFVLYETVPASAVRSFAEKIRITRYISNAR